MKKIKQLTIDESKWGWGNLYDEVEGSYCALGFACRAYGISDEEMDGECLPEELDTSTPQWMFKSVPEDLIDEVLADISEDDLKYRGDDSEFQRIVPVINDASDLSKDEKKSRLKKIFKFVGINLHFKNSENSLMK